MTVDMHDINGAPIEHVIPPRAPSNVLFGSVVLITMCIAVLIVGYTSWEAHASAVRTGKATECVIEQFAEHRASNEAAHRATAEVLKTAYAESPLPLPPHIVDRLKVACAPFIKK